MNNISNEISSYTKVGEGGGLLLHMTLHLIGATAPASETATRVLSFVLPFVAGVILHLMLS